MRIIKYSEYFKESIDITPENKIKMALISIKTKLDSLFLDDTEVSDDVEDENKPEYGERVEKDDIDNSNKLRFSDFGIVLNSSEIIKNIFTLKFSDDDNFYSLSIKISIKDAVAKEDNKDFNVKDIKKASVKLKKYEIDTMNLIGMVNKKVSINKIDEDLINELNIEIDEQFIGDSDDGEFKISY